MKIAYHGSTSMKSDLMTDVKASGAAGFKALELKDHKIDAYLVDHSLPELHKLMKDNRIEPASINSLEFVAFQGKGFARVLNYCRKFSQIASAIECPTIVVVPSPTPRILDGEDILNYPWDRLIDEYVTVLQQLSDIATPYGVRLAFEFLGFGWCSVRTPRAAYHIVRQTDRGNVGMNFDSCHFYAGGGALDEMDAVDPQQLFTFHINDLEDVPKEAITDSVRLLPGLGVIPLPDICQKLKDIGYDGICTIELFRPEYWDWDPYLLAKKCYEATVNTVSPYFSLE